MEDELIREVTINCAERGLLLLRVRDEIRMTIAAYQTLYESSVAFGMRKALQAEQGKSDMERKVSGVYRDPWPRLFCKPQGHVLVIPALHSGLLRCSPDSHDTWTCITSVRDPWLSMMASLVVLAELSPLWTLHARH